jgi:undecaprenyl-diphosphatase
MISPPPHKPPFDWWGLVWLGTGVAMLAASTFIAYQKLLAGKEIALFRHINDLTEKLRVFMLAASLAPEALWIGAAAVVVTFILKLYRVSLELALAIFGGSALVWFLKHFIDRARPEGLIGEVNARVHEVDNGFPSGHVMVVTVIVLVLWPYLPNRWRWLTLLLIPMVGFSRVYLGVHMPLDVVGGFAIGLLVVGALRVIPYKLRTFMHLD